ncbi:MAG: ABC transporter ATP-binding protein [Bacteroidota bacterium]
MQKSKPSSFDRGVLKRLFKLSVPHAKLFWFTFILTVLVSYLSTLRPYLIQYTIDNFIPAKDLKSIYTYSLIIFGLLVLSAIFQLWSSYLGALLGQLIIKDMRAKVFTHLSKLRLKFFDNTPVGTLVTRCISDIETITEVFSEGFISIMGDLLQIVFILFIMFKLDWRLSLVSLSILPFLLLAAYWFKERVRVSFEQVRNKVAELNTFVQEHLTGMQIVQIFNKQSEEFDKFKEINKQHRDANIKGVFYYSVFFPIVEIISSISIGLVVWYGAKETIIGDASAGVIVAFIMYINMFFRPIRQIADKFNTLQMGMVASKRIFNLIDDNSYIEASGTKTFTALQNGIDFQNIGFAYVDDEYVLQNISFHLKKGNNLALVGATGAGKSSIINLLSRFYDYQKGNIYLDGVELKEYNTESLRKNIAVVLQDVFLFSGSIYDNITLFNKEITLAQVEATAKLLGAHQFISKLPLGYYQPVQERGLTLSVGQRQLISFVRAMVINPSILVLDEATSSIDQETEEVIQNAIAKMMEGRTSIVIAHRLSTIQNANEILVLDKGQIMERGTHQSLLQIDEGFYTTLYKKQFSVQ